MEMDPGLVEEGSDSEADVDPYADHQWRRISFQPHGSAWRKRLTNLRV